MPAKVARQYDLTREERAQGQIAAFERLSSLLNEKLAERRIITRDYEAACVRCRGGGKPEDQRTRDQLDLAHRTIAKDIDEARSNLRAVELRALLAIQLAQSD